MDELTAQQRDELRLQLLKLQEELESLLADSTESSKPVDLDRPIGRLSRMDALQQQQMAKANRQAHEQRLQLVVNALKACEQETYGDCRRCEEPIGYARLRVRPETPFCRDCQGQVEGGR